MKTYKKPLFTLVHSNDAIPEHKTLAYLDSTLNDYTDHIDEIIGLRIKELKLHHSEYREHHGMETLIFKIPSWCKLFVKG